MLDTMRLLLQCVRLYHALKSSKQQPPEAEFIRQHQQLASGYILKRLRFTQFIENDPKSANLQ